MSFPKRDSLADVAQKYKDRGSCGEEFKATFVKAAKVGFGVGLPLGVYVAYRQQHRTIKSFGSKMIFTTIATTACMSIFGVIVGTFNCFQL